MIPTRHFTVDEYHELLRAGVLTDEVQIELLDGRVVPRTRRTPRHAATIELANESLRRSLPKDWHIRVQSSITTVDSEPVPDIAIVVGGARHYLARHPAPGDVAMVIEVADQSAQDDRLKRRIYARAQIPHYWIVNLEAMMIEVYSDPAGSGTAAAYRQQVEVAADGQVPFVIDGREVASIPARELLP